MLKISQVKLFLKFLGREVVAYLFLSILVGLLWFFVESSFIYIMQGFLTSVGLIEIGKTFLPAWYPLTIGWALFLLVSYGIARGVIYTIKTFSAAICQQVFIKDQRARIVKHVFRHLENLKSSEMLALFSDKTVNAGMLLNAISVLITTFVSSIAFLGMGFYVAPKEQFIALLLLGVLSLPLVFLSRGMKDSGKNINSEWNKVFDELIKGIKNYIFLKIYGLTEAKSAVIVDSLQNYKNHFRHYLWLYCLRKSYPLVVGILILASVTYMSAYHFNTQPMRLLSFFYIFIRFAQSASDLGGFFSEITLYRASFDELYNLSANIRRLQPLSQKPMTGTINENEPVKLSLKNVSFSYPETHSTVIDNISLNLEKGNFLLIKGASGTGKTTLLYLILGMLKPQKGEVTINGKLVEGSWSTLIDRFAYVGPEPFLIDGSVEDNLYYGSHDKFSESDCWQALEIADLKKDVQELKNGLHTNLQEMTQLSTGQKQRLAISRAFLRRPKIIVLDEATANLDKATEARIIQNFAKLKSEMIFIVVSHKDSFDHLATEINLLN